MGRTIVPTYRRISSRWLALAAVLWLTVSCASQDQPVVPAPPPASPPSAPTPAPTPAPFVVAPAASVVAAEQDVYVSLPPDSIPAGLTATITNRRTGGSVTTAIVAGGFDPVAIPAVTGDTIAITVQTTGSPLSFTVAVPPVIPPVVVRTDPPPDKRDVPLNASLVAVFSQPISVGTLTAATMQLRQGTTTVPGTISVDPATPWLATFTPSQPLAPAATYTFTLTGSIADPKGLILGSSVTISFATASLAPVASVAITPLVDGLGEYIQLTATAKDAAGNILAGRSFAWTSSDRTLATVDSTGYVIGSAQTSGTVTITATTGGQSGSVTMRVDCAVTTGCATRSVTGTFSEMLADGTSQPLPNLFYFAWVNVPHEGGYSTGWRQADASGAFRMDSLPDGLVSVLARPGALAQPCMAAASTVGQNAVLNVTVVDSANPLPLRTTTAPAVTGTVYRLINGVKTPVAGAVVQYNTWVPDLVVAETFADSSGRYALCNLQFSYPNGPLGYISAAAPGNAGSSSGWITVTVSGPGTVDIIVP